MFARVLDYAFITTPDFRIVIGAVIRSLSPQRALPWLVLACLLPTACQRLGPAEPVAATPKTVAASNGEDSGAVSSDLTPTQATTADLLKGTQWPALSLASGNAWVDCNVDAGTTMAANQGASDAASEAAGQAADLATQQAEVAQQAESAGVAGGVGGAGGPANLANPGDAASEDSAPDTGPIALIDLGYVDVEAALAPCRERGTLHLRYDGKIGGDFTALMQRTAAMADRMGIEERVLDINSTGGRIEDAIPAGDAIAESHWTIRVRADSVCHSACVLLLAAGDDRQIAGKVGIHRMVRMGSQASTRAELTQELREVYGEMKDYLERNGASSAVADLMMTVPNRRLRLLGDTELREHGLSGTNAVQDDLDRIKLARKCGDDFVRRKDAFARAYANECAVAKMDRQETAACAVALREDYGFPDDKCRLEGPLAGIP